MWEKQGNVKEDFKVLHRVLKKEDCMLQRNKHPRVYVKQTASVLGQHDETPKFLKSNQKELALT